MIVAPSKGIWAPFPADRVAWLARFEAFHAAIKVVTEEVPSPVSKIELPPTPMVLAVIVIFVVIPGT
jgi:hypothetical protein